MSKTVVPEVAQETWRGLYAAAAEFGKLAPWRYMEDSDLFAVRDESSGRTGYACVMGVLGQVLGLCVYRGEEGLLMYQRLQKGDLDPGAADDVVGRQDALLAEFIDRGQLDRQDLAVILRLGLTFRGPKAWPFFRSYTPGHAPWFLDEGEARFLTLALRAACQAAEDFKKRSGERYKPGCVRTYVFAGCSEAGVSAPLTPRWEPLPQLRRQPSGPLPLAASRIQTILARSPKPGGIWEADVFPSSFQILDRERPYIPKMVMVSHQESCFILYTEVTDPERADHELLAEALLKSIQDHGIKPEVLCLKSEQRVAELAPLGRALGCRLRATGRLRAIEDARRSMTRHFNRRMR